MWFLVWTIIVRVDSGFTVNEYRTPAPTAEACGVALAQKQRELTKLAVDNGAVSFIVRCERNDDA